MTVLLLYLVKVNLALLLFFVVYRIGLYKLTFYTLNRFYLLFAMIFSLIGPLVNLRWIVPKTQFTPDFAVVMPIQQTGTGSESLGFWPFLIASLAIGAMYVFVRFIIRVLSLWRLHRQSFPAQWKHFRYRFLLPQIQPFSFWKNIYVHVDHQSERELQEIFHHEQVHVQELHTLDVLFAELLSVICWYNPVSWIISRAVKENQEFITDRKVLAEGVDKVAYQLSLLQINALAAPETLGNSFNFSHLKRRISMMNSARSSRMQLGKYFFVIPISVLFVFTVGLFGFKEMHSPDDFASQISLNDESEDIPLVAVEEIQTVRVVTGFPIPQVTEVKPEVEPLVPEEARVAMPPPPAEFLPSSSKVVRMIEGDPMPIAKEASIKIIRMEGKRYVGPEAGGSQPNVAIAVRTPGESGSAYTLIDGREGDLSQILAEDIESIQIYKGQEAVKKFGQQAIQGAIEIVKKPAIKP